MIAVEVVYCPGPGQIDSTALALPDGSTLQAALDASGVLQRHGIDLSAMTLAVWGRVQPATCVLRERDRVELCRPLLCDPKEARRLRYRGRAAAKKTSSA
jgi:uncharacterized protein